MNYRILIFAVIFSLTACDYFHWPTKCETPCPRGQKQNRDCSCFTPERFPATEEQQLAALTAIINNDEKALESVLENILPDSLINLNVLQNQEAFTKLYADNIDIFTRLNYQTNNLTLLSLLAPLNGFNDAFQMLLQNGANPDLEAFAALTPLQIAIVSDQGEKVKMLLNAGAKADFESQDNILTAALNLGKYKSLYAISSYAKEKQIPVTFPAADFMNAMIDNKLDLANALLPLTSKEVLNTPNNFGVLPLVQAAFSGNFNLMDSLLKNGADIELVNEAGRTPLLAYLQEVYIAQIEGNFEKNQDPKITETAKYFLSKGANREAKDSNGDDILFYAVRGNNKPLIELLVTVYKHNINTTNNQGETPLFLAAQNAKDMVPFLLANGANPKVIDRNGRTAAIAAAELGNMDIYELIENTAATRI